MCEGSTTTGVAEHHHHHNHHHHDHHDHHHQYHQYHDNHEGRVANMDSDTAGLRVIGPTKPPLPHNNTLVSSNFAQLQIQPGM